MKLKSLLTILLVGCVFSGCKEKTVYEYPFQDPDLSIDERIDDLLSRLTSEEKIGQMMNSTSGIDRLGIPAYNWWNEALHGVARSGRATVFPQAIGLAATFNDQAVYETFDIVSDEARAKYHEYQRNKQYEQYKGLTFWTPNINIFRDPRWGRGMETYGEDPFLSSRMGVAVVKGLQGDDPKYLKSHACAKHYAVHSGPEWNRHQFNAEVTPRDLWTTYLPAFEALVKEANVQEVMCAYNRFEGKPCCSSDKLLIDILRNGWGYKNVIVSDCGAINDFWVKGRHETHSDATDASISAVLSGTDLECGSSYRGLIKGLKEGKIKESDIDISLRRLWKGRFELGMFDPDDYVPYSKIPYSEVESSEHIQKALEMAHQSIVLLKNANNVLPLNKNLKKIAVVGPNADDKRMLWANYNGFPTKTVTILDGIRKKLPGTDVIYELGCNHTSDMLTWDLGTYITSNGKKGFNAQFYNNRNFEGEPAFSGIFDELNFSTWENAEFAHGVNVTDFSAKFDAVFESPVTGDIEFKISADDCFKFFINDENVLEVLQLDVHPHKYILKAQKGVKYNLKLDLVQKGGDAALNFSASFIKHIDFKAVADKVKDAEVIIYAGGLSPRLEGEQMPVKTPGFKEGDRTDIEIPAVQREMVKALKATGKPVIYVVCTGSALALNWEEENLDAIVNAWYGGQTAGTAVADVLFGDYNPAGRLPVTFYKSIDQLPDFEDYNMQGRTYRYMTQTPLYPFGYGLSYSTFEYKNAELSSKSIAPGKSVKVSFDITNTGKMDGDEVVQVYIGNHNDPKGPLKSLRGFKRVHIKAGETEKVTLELAPESFQSFDDETQTFEIRPGKYQVLYGSSSADKDLKELDLIIQ